MLSLILTLACTRPTPDTKDDTVPADNVPADTVAADTVPGDDSAPAAGDLRLIQLDCRGWIGESMLIIGPDGTTALLDVGNDRHAATVSEAVSRYGGHDPTVILTHFHSDHAGGLDGLTVGVREVVSRGPVHTAAVSLPRTFDDLPRTDLCSADACDLPWTLDLGGGAVLTVLAADGQIGGDRFGALPGDDDGENARSLVGTVTWGDFVYLWNGDLTGGGKSTPDLEAFYAARLDLPDGATVTHFGHHGIDSSTYGAWLDRAMPSPAGRIGLVGSNGSYLDAPADEVLDRARRHASAVWTNRGGSLTGRDPLLTEAEDDVVITVTGAGGVAGGTTVRGGGHEQIVR